MMRQQTWQIDDPFARTLLSAFHALPTNASASLLLSSETDIGAVAASSQQPKPSIYGEEAKTTAMALQSPEEEEEAHTTTSGKLAKLSILGKLGSPLPCNIATPSSPCGSAAPSPTINRSPAAAFSSPSRRQQRFNRKSAPPGPQEETNSTEQEATISESVQR